MNRPSILAAAVHATAAIGGLVSPHPAAVHASESVGETETTNSGPAVRADGSYELTSSKIQVGGWESTSQMTASCATGFHVLWENGGKKPDVTFSNDKVYFKSVSGTDPTGTKTNDLVDYVGFTFKLMADTLLPGGFGATMTWTCVPDATRGP